MGTLSFDVAHMLAGSLVLVSFMQLYQDRLYALLNTFALHAFILAASVAWQAFVQDAPHLYLTALIALVVLLAYHLATSDPRILRGLFTERLEDVLLGAGLALIGTVLAFPRWVVEEG